MSKTKIFRLLIFVVFLSSCATTYNRKNPYPNIETVSFTYSSGYEFKNPNSKKLLIIIEGSGWNSVLGKKNNNVWENVGIASQFIPLLQDRFTIFIPEKFNRQPGETYFEDQDERSRYVFDNLLTCYRESITEYLSHNEYESIVIIGGSEGSILLPVLYLQIDNANISLLVSYAGGGLSLHESYPILAASNIIQRSWKKLYKEVIELYLSKPYPDSLETGYIDIRPIDYYELIDIPVLFVHGEKDNRIPVESTRYIEKNLSKKNFNYIYYPSMRHNPYNYKETVKWREDIVNWIIAHNP
jgi:esterase/lipase